MINVAHPTLSSDSYLFLNKDEAIAFFNAFYIPSATVTTEGSVKKASASVYTSFASYTNSDVITVEYSGVDYEVPTRVAHDETRTKLLALSLAFDDLKIKLQLAGILT